MKLSKSSTTVFIYCCPKSDSSSLYQSFKDTGYTTYHTHSLEYYNKYHFPELGDFNKLIDSKQKNTIVFIDSYRTPIERSISCFFEDIMGYFPNKEYLNMSVDELIEYYENNKIYNKENYHSINEILTNYNLPLFDTFNFETGYNKLEYENKIFIKILFKDINTWSNIFKNIFLSEIPIQSINITKNKDKIGDLYQQFIQKYKPSKLYFENDILNNREFKIYNTLHDQELYKTKWLKKE